MVVVRLLTCLIVLLRVRWNCCTWLDSRQGLAPMLCSPKCAVGSYNKRMAFLTTGCSLNSVFFPKILKYSGLWPFSVFPRYQCVYTYQAGRTPALQQNWQSSEKSQHFKEKTQYLMNTLYLPWQKSHGSWPALIKYRQGSWPTKIE